MKIGFLHSVKLNLGSIANAKTYRIHYKEWKFDYHFWFTHHYYGQHTDRKTERGLIYNYRSYKKEFSDVDDYDLIALSLNFDNYPHDFHIFVREVIDRLYYEFPILHQKEVIILAGNEVYEKRQSVEKVIQTTWDTAQGIKNSVKPNLPICCWNQKIRHVSEEEAFLEVIHNDTIKQICKYVGFQSLATPMKNLKEHITDIKVNGFEAIDVECGTFYDNFLEIQAIFDTLRANGVDIVFFMTPFISGELARHSPDVWINYAMAIINDGGGIVYKRKSKIIDYVQQFITFTNNEQEEISDMLDFAIDKKFLLRGSKGEKVRLLQKLLNYWNGHTRLFFKEPLDEDGDYGELTEKAVETFQHWTKEHWLDGLVVDGVAGRNTIKTLIFYFLGIPIKVEIPQVPTIEEQLKQLKDLDTTEGLAPGMIIVK